MRAKVHKVELNTVIVLEEDGDKLLQLPITLFEFTPLVGAHCDIIFDEQETIVKVIDDFVKDYHEKKQEDHSIIESSEEINKKLNKLNKYVKYLFVYIIILTFVILGLSFIIVL